ncbi:hypothetical protein POF45_25545 [Pseudomonas sp. 681]|uniref:Uncharacterized protein n=1 Tax=Pseudomonas fungipugnans TaxID=3024217 RepID=A0ABT6QX51_9PSED|nr:hypothetical protein [Pseudomonas sp. 681]MDI2594767.1 hypothetical protein [Pseudomonas sp. 681]
MNNIKTAKLLHISEENEEHATLLIEGYTIECFINSCPHAIKAGESYSVELTMNLPDSYHVSTSPAVAVLAEKKARGYSYFLYGTLIGDIFKSFTDLYDEDIHYDHPELNGAFIQLEVDRIDVNFL